MSWSLRIRRVALVAAPTLAAALVVAAYFLDPALGESGVERARQHAAHAARQQISLLALHSSLALLAVPAVALIVMVRGRGAWLANLAAVFALVGMTTLPGFVLIAFYDIAIYGELGPAAYYAIDDGVAQLHGATVMVVSGFLGFILALPTALLAAWRGGLLRLWPAPTVLLGEASALIAPETFGLLHFAASLVALSYALRRTTASVPRAPEHSAHVA